MFQSFFSSSPLENNFLCSFFVVSILCHVAAAVVAVVVVVAVAPAVVVAAAAVATITYIRVCQTASFRQSESGEELQREKVDVECGLPSSPRSFPETCAADASAAAAAAISRDYVKW